MRTAAAKNTKVQQSDGGGDEVLANFWAKQTCSTLVEYISSAAHARQGAHDAPHSVTNEAAQIVAGV